MAETYETKKINELDTATSADDSDLMMVGNPDTGITKNITKKNFLQEMQDTLDKNTSNISQNTNDINSLNSALTDLLIVRTIMATSVSCEGSSTCNYTFSDSAIAHSGYTPLGIVGFYANSSQANIYRCNYSSENGLVFGFRNLSSSTINLNIYVYMLYIKS